MICVSAYVEDDYVRLHVMEMWNLCVRSESRGMDGVLFVFTKKGLY